MPDETTARQQESLSDDERPAVSYLVRFWLEPRASKEDSGLFRGYARDLRTGEESYFGDPRGLTEHISRRLQSMHPAVDGQSDSDEPCDRLMEA